jgi:hypothetical protein
MQEISKVYFNDGVAGHETIRLFLASSLQSGDFNLTRLAFLKNEDDWYYFDFESVVYSVCLLIQPTHPPSLNFFALGRDGKVLLIASKSHPIFEEIPDAGTGPNKYGYVTDIQEIGGEIYVCGASGQIYQRTKMGWIHRDQGLLEPLPFKLPRLFLNSIDGTATDDIYAVGNEGYIFHFNGKQWRNVSFETNLNLLSVKCINPDEVYICGQNGLMLGGNHNGWRILIDPDEVDIEELYDIEVFENKIYLSSESGLMIYNRKDIQSVDTGLNPPLIDTSSLSARDGILWSIGGEDLAYYNGKQWRRVIDPDNRPTIIS